MRVSLRGVIVPHRKNTAKMAAVPMTSVKEVRIPTVMHIGAPSKVCVKVGDEVKVGDLIAEQNGFISAPIHSSVSGKVTKISDMLLSSGNMAPAITIESDGEMQISESVKAPELSSKEDVISAIRDCGVVGLGGAGFPTYVKFNTDKEIDYLIINGAECEPYITSDTRTMLDRSEDIYFAIDTILKFIKINNVIIGIEKNKPEAIAEMRKLAKRNPKIKVMPLKSLYPQGGEKVLVYHTTGRTIPMGKLPIDVGCVVSNCTTLAAIGEYFKTGLPLTSKCVTVDGSAVKEPKNVTVPIGASLSDVFDFCGGFSCEVGKVLYGGPMMGISVPSLDVPILKNTNAILAFNMKDSILPEPTSCISCGNCVNHCPLGINPYAIAKAYAKGDLDACEKFGVNLCMECGCCSYICPASRPLVQTNRLVKAELRKIAMEKKKKEEKENGK